ncbi:MAG: phosphoglycerate kinase [Flavobacteriales bacterium]|nr:phosphoglycerate kinase [Flavobacteriales bacterium]
MKNINDICTRGKKVIIRVDFNVPLDKNFNVTDNSRLIAALPTINKVAKEGGKAILISHLGRPKNGFDDKLSLQHIVNSLSILLKNKVSFCRDCIGDTTSKDVDNMKNGDILVLENLRFYKEETQGDLVFAKKLSNLADIYVNDAFGTAHRSHASTAIIANFFPKNKYFGLLLYKELENLKRALENPKKPFTAIIGGAKVSGKIDVIQSLFNKVDNLIIGGGMAYTFAKAVGGSIGKSLVEDDKLDLARKLIAASQKKGVNLILPIDSVNASRFNNDAKIIKSNISNINQEYIGMDIGAKSIEKFSEIILKSKTIVWNGPMGVFEMQNFQAGTKMVGEAICRATKNGTFSLVGGGDSVSAVNQFKLSKDITYLSTGGGAMLEFLEGKKLPGVEAILD